MSEECLDMDCPTKLQHLPKAIELAKVPIIPVLGRLVKRERRRDSAALEKTKSTNPSDDDQGTTTTWPKSGLQRLYWGHERARPMTQFVDDYKYKAAYDDDAPFEADVQLYREYAYRPDLDEDDYAKWQRKRDGLAWWRTRRVHPFDCSMGDAEMYDSDPRPV